MTYLSRFNLTTFQKEHIADHTQTRREKLIAGIKTQYLVLDAALAGDEYLVPTRKGLSEYAVPAWFFAQNGGYYVQCRYGTRPLFLDGNRNAIYVRSLPEVRLVLDAFTSAGQCGELDDAINEAIHRRRIKS